MRPVQRPFPAPRLRPPSHASALSRRYDVWDRRADARRGTSESHSLRGLQHASGVRVGMRIFRGAAAPQCGKVVSIPEADNGDEGADTDGALVAASGQMRVLDRHRRCRTPG